MARKGVIPWGQGPFAFEPCLPMTFPKFRYIQSFQEDKNIYLKQVRYLDDHEVQSQPVEAEVADRHSFEEFAHNRTDQTYRLREHLNQCLHNLSDHGCFDF